MPSRNEENENDRNDATGAEIRRDLRGEVVIVSPGRAGRPYDFSKPAEARRGDCPFCPGHEARTPPEVDALRDDGSEPDRPGWTIRVVPNKYPAFPTAARDGDSAWGVHEAIIETAEHDRGLAEMSVDQLARVLEVYQRRIRAARQVAGIRYACVFKNHGPQAGASLEHSHAQLMALPFVPQRIRDELRAHRQGAFQAKAQSAKPVADSPRLVAFCPPEARLPYEVWLGPNRSAASFEDEPAGTVAEAAGLLSALLGAMNDILDRPPYHLLVHTAPFQGGDDYCWRIELVPRMARIAGFELATGVFVNQTAPAQAAAAYRAKLR